MQSYEFLIEGRPASVQASRKVHGAWKERVHIAALRSSPAVPPFTRPCVWVTIIHLCDHPPLVDADNIIKPIQDALSIAFYADDEMVSDVESHRRTWADPVLREQLPRLLRDAWVEQRECVYVRITERRMEDPI